jgi:hypothetical protein
VTSIGRPPGDVAFQSVVASAGGISGVEHEIVGVLGVALEAGLDLRVVPVQIENVGVDLEPMIEQIRLVTRLQLTSVSGLNDS